MQKQGRLQWGLPALVVLSVLAGATDDILVADFEGQDYGTWEVAGEAFGPGPARGTLPNQMRVSGFEGKGLVNSFYKGDGATGTLTSPTFTLERTHLNFLIGGGKYPGKTCMNLLVDGQVVRTATGPNDRPGGSERLDWCSWDVVEFAGKQAVIQIVDQRTGGWGHVNVDHIVQSNDSFPLPDLKKAMRIEHDYLHLPVKNGAEMRRMKLSVDGKTVREFDIELAEADADFWVFVDVRSFRGRTAVLEVNQPRGSNAESLETVTQGDTLEGAENLYKEKYRPQFHFSSRRGWNNDPNGLVYHQGEYHLFYQHNPYGWRWGNMHWGHAVSPDLVHWKELGDALYPDDLGTIYSGSAVVDEHNTAGFQTGDEKVIVCIYTSAGSHAPKPVPFTQSIAYSNDRGRTWTKYESNPVLGHIVGSNRDPKVIWHAPSHQWIMALFLDRHDYVLFASPDLKAWSRLCDIEVPEGRECPDFFELPVDTDPKNARWVFWGANGSYVLGTFDGKTFTKETGVLHSYAGGNAYAAQTWSDVPGEDDRRIQISWLRRDMPGMPFNQMMAFPVELTLRTTEDGIRLFSLPVREIETIHEERHAWQDLVLEPGINPLSEITGELFDIRAEFQVGDTSGFGFNLRGVPVVYDAEDGRLSCQGQAAPLKPLDGRIRLQILVDRTSIEVFGNDGRFYLPTGVLLDENDRSLAIFSEGGATKVSALEIYKLESTWDQVP